jgi:hypothetical protein
MKYRYKILSVLLILTMIGSVYAAVQTSQLYTGCVAASNSKGITIGTVYNVKAGTSPISTCKTGDYQASLYDKIQIDSLISSITNQINSLATRISNLESDPYPKLYTNRYNFTSFNVNNGNSQLASLTFTLPRDAIVQIQTDGMFINWLGYSAIGFDVFDTNGNQDCLDWCQMVFYGDGKYDGSGQWTGFEQSKAGNLKAGTYTVKVHGLAYGSASYQTDNSVGVWTRITVTAYDINKGDIQQPMITQKSSANPNIAVAPPRKQ